MPSYPANHESAESPELLSTPELNLTVWDRVAARLLAKMLGEFAYEEVIEPAARSGGSDTYTLTLDDGATLSFRAGRGVYGSWHVAADSMRASDRDAPAGTGEDGSTRTVPFRDPLQFLARARHLLRLDGTTLGHLIREITTTLAADARLEHTTFTAARLAELDYAELEGHQTGHPWLVANKGRLGFSAADASASLRKPADRSSCPGSLSVPGSAATGV